MTKEILKYKLAEIKGKQWELAVWLEITPQTLSRWFDNTAHECTVNQTKRIETALLNLAKWKRG